MTVPTENTSDSRSQSGTPSIVEALSAVMGDVRAVGKDSVNQQQHFNFRGIDAVVNAVSPVLRKHGVVVTPEVTMYEHGTVQVGNNRTSMGHVRVIVKYTFTGPAGDSIACSTPGEAMDSGDKATAKAMSVAFRTALLQALSLPTTDIDPDAQTYERSAPQQRQTTPNSGGRPQQRQQRAQEGGRQHQARPQQGQNRPQPSSAPQQSQAATVTPETVREQIKSWSQKNNVAGPYVIALFNELHPNHGGWDHATVEVSTLNSFFLTLQKRVKQGATA